ncbi:MAG: YdcF family protein [Rhodanobacter sp.]
MSAFRFLLDSSSPVTQSLALASLALVWLILRHYRTGAALLVLSALWLGLCSTPGFADRLQRGLQDQYPSRPATSYPTADAIVVLGGGEVPGFEGEYDDDPDSIQTTRTGFGFKLFKADRAPIILISGERGEAEEAAQMLVAQGVPHKAILIDNDSHTTHQNAVRSASLLRKAGLSRILLVTSVLHMPRAAATFRRQGLDVVAAPAIEPPVGAAATPTWLPRRSALRRSRHCLREYIGRWVYELRGWA